jgi:hypothetical protein
MKQHPFRLDTDPHATWRVAYDESHYTLFRDEVLVGQGAFSRDPLIRPDAEDVRAFAIAQAERFEPDGGRSRPLARTVLDDRDDRPEVGEGIVAMP